MSAAFALRGVLCLLGLSALCLPDLHAQITLSGKIQDSETGEALPVANIQVEGRYQGAISNREGIYRLSIDRLPATVVVRYIGYETQRISIAVGTKATLNIFMVPAPYAMKEVVITGEDPGVRIMRGVIEKKKRWQHKLETFRADAYTRVVIANDSGIVMIAETLSDFFWDRRKGLREIVKSKRQTANVDPNDVISSTDYSGRILNLYDDDVALQGFQFVGPTHPDALDFYDFSLQGTRRLEGQAVYDIAVRPKSRLQPLFEGTVAVLDEDSAMIEARLRPGDAVVFPPPINAWLATYAQQFSNFGEAFWLPVDIRVDGTIKIGMVGLSFPAMKYQQISGLTDYRVNTPLEDSLFEGKQTQFIDSTSLARTGLFDSSRVFVPLSTGEDSAYHRIKRGDSFGKAFKPRGFLARFVKVEDTYNDSVNADEKQKSAWSRITRGMNPRLWYDRVDGAHLGMQYEWPLTRTLTVAGQGGYTTSLRRWTFGGTATQVWGAKGQGAVSVSYTSESRTRYFSDTYGRGEASLSPLLGGVDYFDYYWGRRLELTTSYTFKKRDLKISAGVRSEMQSSLSKTTDYDLLGSHTVQRINPAIPEGTLRAVEFSAVYGGDYVPLGIVGQNRLAVSIEHSPRRLAGDFSFTTYRAELDWRIKTFLKRRFLPLVLDVRMIGGTFSGHLPIQQFGIVDGALDGSSPFGALKSLPGRPLEGEKYAAIFWEHNFRTLPFELVGLQGLAHKGLCLIVHGAAGRTWIRQERLLSLGYAPKYADRIHHEIGISLSGIFDLLRIDLTQRLDRPGFFVGLSMARLF